jgi:delta24(24(1))-sterol reductase
LPWGILENPKFIKAKCGSTLLIDGFWKYARKIHYTADMTMALLWGLCCGFDSFIPYIYFFFFVSMLLHRE